MDAQSELNLSILKEQRSKTIFLVKGLLTRKGFHSFPIVHCTFHTFLVKGLLREKGFHSFPILHCTFFFYIFSQSVISGYQKLCI